MNDEKLDKDGFYKKPLTVGKCPICGGEVKRLKPLGSDFCVKEGCPYDTSG